MENPIMENPQSATFSSTDVDHHSENMISHHPNDEEAEPKCDVSAEEIRSIMEVIAATGKFWHDWDMLKSLLSFQLKQVLVEYPEAQMVSSVELQQNSLSGETYPELVKWLDEDKRVLEKLIDFVRMRRSEVGPSSNLEDSTVGHEDTIL